MIVAVFCSMKEKNGFTPVQSAVSSSSSSTPSEQTSTALGVGGGSSHAQALAQVNAQMQASAALGSVRGAAPSSALEVEDVPCVIALSASGRIARLSATAWDVYHSRNAATPRYADDTLLSYSIIYTFNVCAHYVSRSFSDSIYLDLPQLPVSST